MYPWATIALTAALYGPAADGACEALDTARPIMGSQVSPSPRCDELVLTTDAGAGPFSWGQIDLVDDMPPRFELSLVWQRLTSDDHLSLELGIPGGRFMLRRDGYGFYESDAQFAEYGGYQPLAGHTNLRANRIRLRQEGRAVQAWVDGEPLPPFQWSTQPGPITLDLALKGLSGHRSRVRVREFRITRLD